MEVAPKYCPVCCMPIPHRFGFWDECLTCGWTADGELDDKIRERIEADPQAYN